VYEIITIPFNSITKTFDIDDLNAFCVNKKVVSTKIEFFRDEKNAYWTVFIEYETVLERNNHVRWLDKRGALQSAVTTIYSVN